MEKYAPNKMELASRDVVSRSEQTEINEGRGFPDGTVALDITKVPRKRTLEALREIVNIGRDFAGVDITREPIHIKPGCHYIMGGVKTDTWGATTIPGLYAAGEVACVSVHGGNRLGANSLLDTLIFGRRSGEHAAQRAAGMPMPSASRAALADEQKMIDQILGRGPGGRRISEIKDELGTMMNEKCAVFRDEAGLTEAHGIIRRLKEEASVAAVDDRGTVFNQDVLGAIELGYMLDVAECIVVGALERKESRGAQFRLDFPKRDDDTWLKHINLSRNGTDAPEISYSPVTMTQWEPQERTYMAPPMAPPTDGRLHASDSAATRPRRARRPTGRTSTSISTGTAPSSTASSRPRTARTPRSASAAPAAPRSAAPAACASTASRAWPATCTSTRPPGAPTTASSPSSRWATCP